MPYRGSFYREKTIRTPRNAIGKVLLEVCDRDILTSERVRSADVLKASHGKLLDKRMQKLTECLSYWSVGTAETVIKNPQCFLLWLIRSLEEVESDPDKSFYKIYKAVRQ